MRAIIKSIDCCSECDWEDVVRSSTEPWKDGIYLTVHIGPEEEEGADMFNVCVCTPSAKHRFVKSEGMSRIFLVDSYDPETIQQTLDDRVSAVTGDSWSELSRVISSFMYWEYEGMEFEGMG